MDESRRKRIELLALIADSSDFTSCWGTERAEVLLRSHFTREELLEAGVDRELVEHLWRSE
ncbi:MAG TPA: hypothetical protein VMT00_06315 [Thermoanaerobaculia bacterium]|nr:hypothetical protein [Thermoanaerobaculia bacterium]